MYYSYGYGNPLEKAKTALIIILILSLIAAFVGIFYFVNKRRYDASAKKPLLNWLFRFVNFDTYILASIVKFFYIFITVFCVLGGIVMLFVDGMAATGFAMMIAGPIMTRLMFEMLYVFFSLHGLLGDANRTLVDIKRILKPESERAARRARPAEDPGYAAPRQAAPRQAAPAETRTCPFCGKEVRSTAPFCTNCGSRF